MSYQLWIGFGFLTALVIFLVVSFFVTPKLTTSQGKTIRFLTALCAGVSGGFLSGSSVFDATWTTPTSRIALSGTAGFALFFAVFFFYDRVFTPEDSVEFDIPDGATFRQTLDKVAQLANISVDYQVLSTSEQSSLMQPGHISCETFEELFTSLRLRTKKVGSVKNYAVTRTNNIYSLVR